jgi:hypothetical protein
MQRLASLFADGGPWMYPVAAIGVIGVSLAVINAFTRRDRTSWAVLSLTLCLLAGMFGASFSMIRVLDHIAAGPGGHKLWLPLHLAAARTSPVYLAALLAAAGAGLLGLSRACRCRREPGLAAARLIDGLVGASVLFGVATISHVVPEMLISAAAVPAEEAYVAMARGLAGAVRQLLWPASTASALLVVRAVLLSSARAEKVGPRE